MRSLRLELADNAVGGSFIVDLGNRFLRQLLGAFQILDGTTLQSSLLAELLFKGIVSRERGQRTVGGIAGIDGLDGFCQIVSFF